MGELIPLDDLNNMNYSELVVYYRIIEQNVEVGIAKLKYMGSIMHGKQVSKYDDMNDVFPDDII